MRAWRMASSMRIGRRRGGATAVTAEMLSIIAATCLPGEPEVAVAALLRRHDQACPGELAEMAARGLRRDVRRVGEFARGQRAAVEQRDQHVGARRIADQRGDGGDIEDLAHARYSANKPGRHARMLRPSPKCLALHFGGGRNVRGDEGHLLLIT